MNRQIRRLGLVLVALFVAMYAKVNHLQVIEANQLAHHPGNTRDAVRDFGRPRGAIVTADGVVVAESVPNPNRESKVDFLRRYPQGRLYGHLTGFFSFTYGSTGIEHQYNAVLAGRRGALTMKRFEDLLRDRTVTADVRLTIDDRVQRVAAAALGKRKGSVVALDPRTGAIRAFVSYPSYDPSGLAGVDQANVRAVYDALNADPDKPLLARAYRERYPPGSTFKIVTTSAGLASGTISLDTEYPVLTELTLPLTNRPLRNFGGRPCGGPLLDAFKQSCNTSFAQMGLDLGADTLRSAALAFGFEKRPPVDLSPQAAESAFPEESFFVRNTPALAQSAIGQSEVAATPLQMALVAGAIANGGEIMVPYVRDEVRDSSGAVVERGQPRAWRRAVEPEVASAVRDLMVEVVASGTGTRAAVPGVRVAAKTGTAQTGSQRAHAWIVAFAPAEDPVVAVAVIVENQPEVSTATGGRIAAPVAARVIQEVLSLAGSVEGA